MNNQTTQNEISPTSSVNLETTPREYYANTRVILEACELGTTSTGWPSVTIELDSSSALLRVAGLIIPLIDSLTKESVIKMLDMWNATKTHYDEKRERQEIMNKLDKVFELYESEFKN